jgi:hypothetical protein
MLPPLAGDEQRSRTDPGRSCRALPRPSREAYRAFVSFAAFALLIA